MTYILELLFAHDGVEVCIPLVFRQEHELRYVADVLVNIKRNAHGVIPTQELLNKLRDAPFPPGKLQNIKGVIMARLEVEVDIASTFIEIMGAYAKRVVLISRY